MGLTIHNAPVELREKLAVPEAEWPRAIEELCGFPHIEEAAVLSTCNRMELYVVALSWHRWAGGACGLVGLDLSGAAGAWGRPIGGGHPGAARRRFCMCAISPGRPAGAPLFPDFPAPTPTPPPSPPPCRGVREVEEWLSRSSGVPLEELRPYLFLLRDRDATNHLLRVSGGLDSLVMGEGQILAQVKQVYKVGQNSNGFGRQLNGLFKQAITAGKRVRSETSISTGGVSVSSAAVELGKLKLPTQSYADARVCIIGAGKMSTLLVKHLLSKGCSRVTVLNRSMPRAEALAEEFPDMAFDIHLMPDLMACVEASDVIFAASGGGLAPRRAAPAPPALPRPRARPPPLWGPPPPPPPGCLSALPAS